MTTPTVFRRKRGSTTPSTIYKFWFSLNVHGWSSHELVPIGSSFPNVVLEIFGWLYESKIKPLSVEMMKADSIGFWFTDLPTATMFKLRWSEYIAHEGDL
ncbi:hypothetical protein [Microvirga soli]|uniref:hypothetical protein n=1 Tax=Microvirga soli TaxID=1854496 RepID=UPI00191F2EA6|nr:hypothetical protein [Microvirga soli]